MSLGYCQVLAFFVLFTIISGIQVGSQKGHHQTIPEHQMRLPLSAWSCSSEIRKQRLEESGTWLCHCLKASIFELEISSTSFRCLSIHIYTIDFGDVPSYTGWWFGTWVLWLSIQLGMSSSQLTFTPSFFRGVGQPPTRWDIVNY